MSLKDFQELSTSVSQFHLLSYEMGKRKSEDKLIRFVWSRNSAYDYFLLLEVQNRNPFSFKKPKQVWEDVAAVLRTSELKMKVTERSCRERVMELLKKHRKQEAKIIRS